MLVISIVNLNAIGLRSTLGGRNSTKHNLLWTGLRGLYWQALTLEWTEASAAVVCESRTRNSSILFSVVNWSLCGSDAGGFVSVPV